jgi:hypothetical protein
LTDCSNTSTTLTRPIGKARVFDDITAVVIKVQEVVPSDHAGWGFADQALSGDGPAPKRIQEIGVAPMTVPACSAFLRRNNDGVSEVPAAFFPREEPGATPIG